MPVAHACMRYDPPVLILMSWGVPCIPVFGGQQFVVVLPPLDFPGRIGFVLQQGMNNPEQYMFVSVKHCTVLLLQCTCTDCTEAAHFARASLSSFIHSRFGQIPLSNSSDLTTSSNAVQHSFWWLTDILPATSIDNIGLGQFLNRVIDPELRVAGPRTPPFCRKSTILWQSL